MEKRKLISMTDYAQEMFEIWTNDNNPDCQSSARYILGTKRYSDFLKQPLNLGMFIPCDEHGNVYIDYHSYQPKAGTVCEPYQGLFEVSKKGKDVELLNEPQFWKEDQRYYNKRKYEEALKKYQEAKSKVLFENKPKDKYEFHEDCTILNDRIIFSKSGKVFAIHKSEQYETIEDLIQYNLELTENALKF